MMSGPRIAAALPEIRAPYAAVRGSAAKRNATNTTRENTWTRDVQRQPRERRITEW